MNRKWTDVRVWWLAVEVSGRGSRIYDREYAPEEERRPDTVGWQPPGSTQVHVPDVRAMFEGIVDDD